MRILIANWTRRQAGGAERYLHRVVPLLAEAGHEVALVHELDAPAERDAIGLPSGAPVWQATPDSLAEALRRANAWHPDILFVHGLLDPEIEAALQDLAPAVLYVHGYYGTCVSGAKTFKHATVRPCTRRFGPACLLHYFPHRCGGLDPLTMARDYQRQGRRLSLLQKYGALAVTSEHMHREYLRHDVRLQRLHLVTHYVPAADAAAPAADTPADAPPPGEQPARRYRLLFLGRMDPLKGGQTLLQALPAIARSLDAPVHLTMAGDGPERAAWERRAHAAHAHAGPIHVTFPGWLEGAALERAFASADLLVLPSLWPEPFGQVGPEAGHRAVPAAAFAVGGIPQWLEDGVNGRLAPGDPPTAEGLASAVVACLADPAAHARLRRGARERAAGFNAERHLRELTAVFDSARGVCRGR